MVGRCDPPVFASLGGKMSSLEVASAVFIFCTSYVLQKKKWTRKKLVANSVVQNEVCVQWYQVVSRVDIAVS
jgi:hypothetical protein